MVGRLLNLWDFELWRPERFSHVMRRICRAVEVGGREIDRLRETRRERKREKKRKTGREKGAEGKRDRAEEQAEEEGNKERIWWKTGDRRVPEVTVNQSRRLYSVT